jgi:hypothetical protein
MPARMVSRSLRLGRDKKAITVESGDRQKRKATSERIFSQRSVFFVRFLALTPATSVAPISGKGGKSF